ncbi:MAG: hypothetical protein M1839_008578 [Geoglossum umbratile]|nr:MAG: hypothetical protein M1839_008578 [Geoglossum umbratile]
MAMGTEYSGRSTLLQKDLIIGLLLARTTLLWKHGQHGFFNYLIYREPTRGPRKNPHRSFWEGAAPHLSLSYPGYFQDISTRDLEDQFNHLTWDLSRRSEIPEREPRQPDRRFSWQECWILYGWGLGIPLFVEKLPETFGVGVNLTEFATSLNPSPIFSEAISVDDLRCDIEVIRDILEAQGNNRFLNRSKPIALKSSQSLQQPTSEATKSKEGLRKRKSSQGLQSTTKTIRSTGSPSPSPEKAAGDETDEAQVGFQS